MHHGADMELGMRSILSCQIIIITPHIKCIFMVLLGVPEPMHILVIFHIMQYNRLYIHMISRHQHTMPIRLQSMHTLLPSTISLYIIDIKQFDIDTIVVDNT